MRNKKIIMYSVIFMLLPILYYFVDSNETDYSATMLTYTENTSYVEYPQIQGLEDKMKQNTINKLLKDQVLFGAKNYLNETFVDFSNPNIIFEFKSGIGLTNNSISSFWYSFFSYDENGSGSYGFQGYTERFYCITIDMATGEKINLSDFMAIDERLINSTDCSNTETDYNAENPTFHKFKDAFMVYTAEEEKDAHHIFTTQEAIDRLKDTEGETTWYIDEHKNIVFCYGTKNYIQIPYTEISELIYPRYLIKLEK